MSENSLNLFHMTFRHSTPRTVRSSGQLRAASWWSECWNNKHDAIFPGKLLPKPGENTCCRVSRIDLQTPIQNFISLLSTGYRGSCTLSSHFNHSTHSQAALPSGHQPLGFADRLISQFVSYHHTRYHDGLKKRHGVRIIQDYWLSSSVHVGFSIRCECLISPCWPSLYHKPLPFLSYSVSQYTLERLRLLHKLGALQPAGGAEENYSLGPTSFWSY